jgi:DNA-binding transcriptional MocR family regulator
MPLARRLALLNWARQRDALIVEDDYDGELRYDGQPLGPCKVWIATAVLSTWALFLKCCFRRCGWGMWCCRSRWYGRFCRPKHC